MYSGSSRKTLVIWLVLAVVFFLPQGLVFGDNGCETAFPGDEWEQRSPESQEVDSAKLSEKLDKAIKNGGVISGELKKWHIVTMDFEGPEATESDNEPNPFLDYRLNVEFVGPTRTITGGHTTELGEPPHSPEADWVVFINRGEKF